MESVTSSTRQKCCSVSYKMRCFYSKGAFLIVFWAFLASLTIFLSLILLLIFRVSLDQVKKFEIFIPAIPLVACAPIVGWIADSRCGNYRMLKFGAILMLLATIVACICELVIQNAFADGYSPKIISNVAVCVLAVVGGMTCLVTGLQLGLDQMPDASSSNITSFIAWFVFALLLGMWTLQIVGDTVLCTHSLSNNYWIPQIFSLFPAVFMSIICCSLFFLGPKWLIIEPNCPQSLKTIYQVLKFAWKHKSPLNRSALTYWEENVPSRMDLGKSRYGGPFTTEQVEDVKTFFKIILIFLPLSLVMCSFSQTTSRSISSVSRSSDIVVKCDSTNIAYAFLCSGTTVMVIASLVYELILYPLIRNRLPNTLKCMEIVAFLVVVFNVVKLVKNTIFFVYPEKFSPWYDIIHSIPLNCLLLLLLKSFLEFVCAQSPYKMRGLLLGYVVFLWLISFAIRVTTAVICQSNTYYIGINDSIFTALSLIGFVLYCLLARWYKLRVREEEYNVQRGVEEVYDRYLSQRQSLTHYDR